MKPALLLDAPTTWELALQAASVFAVAPHALGGIRVLSPAGVVRDSWMSGLRILLPVDEPVRRVPCGVGDGRLLGGLDLAATLQSGQPVAERGILVEADRGIVVLPMAERTSVGTAARIASAMDQGSVTTERDGITAIHRARFGVVALDEGLDEEEVPPRALTERLALVLDLRGVTHRDTAESREAARIGDKDRILAARQRLDGVHADDTAITALCNASLAMGIMSLRASQQAVLVARILAALAGRDLANEADAATAAMLVLAPRAMHIPAFEQESTAEEETPDLDSPPADDRDTPQEDTRPESDSADQQQSTKALEDVVIDAAVAAIPAGLLALLKASGSTLPRSATGRAGQAKASANRGRIIGARSGDIRSGARLDVVETLRSAAPWQLLRRRQSPTESSNQCIAVRREDFRIARYKHRTQTTTIFVVDASGSSAMQRLAEAKGAIRLLLAECYVRRDEVAMIAFRGTTAEVILPPTRALARAQRALAALPGGGGTPIATGIDAAGALVDSVRRGGRTPTVVVMTDGRANVSRNGSGGRAAAQEEARQAAKALRQRQCSTILIDTSAQPQHIAAELAAAMGARYVPLPHADAQSVATAVNRLRADAASMHAKVAAA